MTASKSTFANTWYSPYVCNEKRIGFCPLINLVGITPKKETHAETKLPIRFYWEGYYHWNRCTFKELEDNNYG